MAAHPLPAAAKVRLVALTWLEYALIVGRLRRISLPRLVEHLKSSPHRVALPSLDPSRLGKLVARILNQGPHRPRCLTLSLVLYRMLIRQGTAANLVIGLPAEPSSHKAHAWVEVDGRVIGPPPGRLGHEEMARYGG